MVKAVLDTNILVSSLLTSGPPAVIIDLAANGKIIPCYNDLILREYWNVLSRKKFGFSLFQVTHLENDIIRIGIAVDNVFAGETTTDADDQVFYNTAVHTQAYLITAHIRHFPQKKFVVSPAQFLAVFGRYDEEDC